ncbi:MAG: hypothetical protein AAFQ68_15875 [Bacteroidota bacterium]
MEKPADLLAHNESQFEALIELLQEGKAIQAIAVSDDNLIRDELLDSAINHTNLQPILLDLSKTQVQSLREALEQKIPESILESNELSALIHIANLEGSLLSEQLSGEAKLLPYLAEQGVELAQQFPSFQRIFWIDQYLYTHLQSEAPTLLESLDGVFHFFNPKGAEQNDDPYAKIGALKAELDGKEEAADRGPLLIQIGQILEKALRTPEASLYFEQALEAASVAENDQVMADAYRGFGNLMMSEQDLAQAMDNYEIALEKYTALEAKADESEVRNRLARILSQMGDLSGAIKHQQAGFLLARESDDHRTIGLNAKRLAYFYEKRGDLDAAVKTYAVAADAYETLEEDYEVALCHQQRGAIRENQLQPAEALECFQAALAAARKSENEYLINALEDSVEDLEGKLKKKSPSKANSEEEPSGRRGFFRKLFGS